jgi:hypothetical protein
MEHIYGPWERQPLGSGTLIAVVAFPMSIICLIGWAVATRLLYLRLSPLVSEARGVDNQTAGQLPL